MSLKKLRRSYEERRIMLAEALRTGDLDAAKQHQLYGAIREIDNLLKAIDNLEEEEQRGLHFELQGATRRAAGRTRRAAKAIGSFWSEKVSGRVKGAVHATRKRMRLIKDVAREVKQRSKEQKE